MDIKVDDTTVVVFDLDDTLYNELDYLKSAYKAISLFLDPFNWKTLYSIMFSLYRSDRNVFEYLTNVYDIEIITLINMYRNHKPDILLFDGVWEVLEAIKSKNAKIGIITDGRSKTQRAKMESLGILGYIDKVVISEEIGSEKPNLANFKAIEDYFPGQKYYYIADNLKKDFIVPNLLGWKSLALIDNGKNIHYTSHESLDLEKLPNHFILDFKDIKII